MARSSNQLWGAGHEWYHHEDRDRYCLHRAFRRAVHGMPRTIRWAQTLSGWEAIDYGEGGPRLEFPLFVEPLVDYEVAGVLGVAVTPAKTTLRRLRL